ncbi:hypothetical protein D3C85_1400670 [compost metagenome]
MPKAEGFIATDFLDGGWIAYLVTQGLQQRRHQVELVQFIDDRWILLKTQIVTYGTIGQSAKQRHDVTATCTQHNGNHR